VAAGAGATEPGSAASEPQAPPSSGGNDGSDIVVTALRRSVSVQDIPASITAVSGDTLLSRGVTDTIALANVIPGLVFVPNFGNTIVTIRGVGSTSVAGSSEPTVAIYSDGAYLPRPFMGTLRAVDLDRVEVLRGPQGTLYDFRPNGNPSAAVSVDGVYQGSAALVGGQMFDVSRIEILKGPQGTLYGQTTTAGAVNIISNQPGNTLQGNARVEYGRFNSWRAEAVYGNTGRMI